MEKKPKVLIIYTGGTIGMIKDIETGQLISFNFNHLYEHLPELKRINVEMKTISFEKPIDSSEINPSHWKSIAEIIFEHYNAFDGFVVLHGSDTMAYTASALSFMFDGLKKPIIITGSQLPIGIIRTDGKENLITSIEIAAAKVDNEPIVQEVAIYFEYHLYRGNRSTKYSATNFEAIQSPNYNELATAGVEIEYNQAKLFRDSKTHVSLNTATNSRVALIKLFPGIDFSIYEALFDRSRVDGIILETFGAGNAPSSEVLKSVASKFIQDGGVILNITQCSSGGVKQGLYETSALFNEIGVISGHDLTSEAAVTKMMVALAAANRSETVAMLKADLRGEVTLS